MDEGGDRDWRDILWQLFKPALVAAIVALLVAMGVVGLRTTKVVTTNPEVGVQAMTTFSGPLNVLGGIQAGNNLTLTNGSIVNSKGAITVTDSVSITGVLQVAAATVGGVLNVGSDLAVNGGLGVLGDTELLAKATVGTWLLPSVRSGITVTAYITPTGTFQPIRAAAWVSPTLNVSVGSAGSLLVLYNTNTENIFLQDTGNLVLAGDWTAGQYDSITLLNDGSRWIEVSRSNN